MPGTDTHAGDQDQSPVDRYVALLRQTPQGLDLSMKVYDQQIMMFFTTGMVLIGKLVHKVSITLHPAGLVVQLYNLLNIQLIIQQIYIGVFSTDLFETWLALVFFNSVRTVLTISEVVNQDVDSYISEYMSLETAIDNWMQQNNELTAAVIKEKLGVNAVDALQVPIDALVTSANVLNNNRTNLDLVKKYEQCIEKVIDANNRYKASQEQQNLTQDLKEILKLRRREELKKFKVCTSTPSIIYRVLRNMLTFHKRFERVNDMLASKAKDGVKYSDIKSELETFDEQDKDFVVSRRIQQAGMRLYAQYLEHKGEDAKAVKEAADTMDIRPIIYEYGAGFSEGDFILGFSGESEALTTQLTIMINDLYEGKDNGVTYEDIANLVDVLDDEIVSDKAQLVEIMTACKSGQLLADVNRHKTPMTEKGLIKELHLSKQSDKESEALYKDLVGKIAKQGSSLSVGELILSHLPPPQCSFEKDKV